ncbi:MAG TPA: ATP-binding cassette domain-containing protein [Acidimicrobiales bacterium]|nr:ATP-binding cassette domain-containing protein [Acidimicrobiales bacterium]
MAKRFGSVVALDGIDFDVPAATVLGLLGPNGAGKTTTVRILTTILSPDAGRATVLGHDVAREPEAVRHSIGLAGQYAAVDELLTGRENLVMVGRLAHLPKATARSRADELLGRFGLAEAADRVVGTYSGGMRRRLDLAAALVHRPRVLFLDEPTTGLDPRSRNDLWDVIGELVADGTTIVLTTQYLEEADRLAERIVVVDVGRVIADGTPSELKRRVGGTVIEVAFEQPHEAQRAGDLLTGIGPVERFDERNAVGVTVQHGTRAVVEVLRTLEAAGLPPEHLAVREPTLDDVFLQLTGRRAESA